MVWLRVGVVAMVVVVAAGSAPLTPRARAAEWTDVSSGSWAHQAVDEVARRHAWMRDFGKDSFLPNRLEGRALFARALIRAFAHGAEPREPSTFTDLPSANPFYPYAAIAVERGWIGAPDGTFRPDAPVTVRQVHRALVLALGLRAEARGLDRLHTAAGTPISVPHGFGTLTLGMVLGFRTDHSDETHDVGPSSQLSRAEVAFSMWRAYQAATVSTWKLTALAKYANIELPDLKAGAKAIIEFGSRYVGYPYVWAGEWDAKTTSDYCCGQQPIGGFDCSGIVWWTMKAAEGGYDDTSVRGYAGWSLKQRSSSEMAAVGDRLTYREARPGDLLFFDGNADGTIDHVNIYLGRGWALDSSNGYGGVSIIRVGEGWYREHFTHARRIIGA